MIRGLRVEDDGGQWCWLTWEVADGPFWRYEQRQMNAMERVLWRAFRRVPRIS